MESRWSGIFRALQVFLKQVGVKENIKFDEAILSPGHGVKIAALKLLITELQNVLTDLSESDDNVMEVAEINSLSSENKSVGIQSDVKSESQSLNEGQTEGNVPASTDAEVVDDEIDKVDKETKKSEVKGQTDSDMLLKSADSVVSPEAVVLDPNLVQIRADKKEIERRIAAFIEKKQSELNAGNQREFCNAFKMEPDVETNCARTEAVFVPRAGSKSHVKVSRVYNLHGPQTLLDMKEADTFQHPTTRGRLKSERDHSRNNELPQGVEERLENMETHLKLNSGSRISLDVYERIKQLEERILYLESLSPEYFQTSGIALAVQKSKQNKASRNTEQTSKYSNISMSEINDRIHSLRSSLKRKMNDSQEIKIKQEIKEEPLS